MTTDREYEPSARVQPPHSAVPHTPAPGGEDANASGRAPKRAGARENNAASAQPQPHSADPETGTEGDGQAAEPAESAGPSLAERARAVAAAGTPPDVWAADRPALRAVWAYARRGEWTTRTGVWRRAGCVYAFAVAVPVTALAYYLAWICERPSRLLAAALLLIVFAQIPPLSWLV
jgi:hypothetical protein